MASTDSRPLPLKNTAFRLYFTAYNSSGVPVTGFTTPDSKLSLDGGAYADATNEATYVGHGQGYIEITSSEMNYDHVGFYFSCVEGSTRDCISICPAQDASIPTNVKQINGTSQTARDIGASVLISSGTGTGQLDVTSGVITSAGNVTHTGTAQAGASTTITLASGANSNSSWYNRQFVQIVSGTGAGQVRQIYSYVGSSRIATVNYAWITNPDNTSVYRVIAANVPFTDASGIAWSYNQLGQSIPIATANAAAVWDYLTSAATTANSIGKRLVEFITTLVYSAAPTAADIRTEIDTNSTKLDVATSTRLATASYSAPPSAATIADAVCDEAVSDHTTAGTVGANLASIYAAQIDFADDNANTKDEYSVQWFKNGAPVTSGITAPTIQVVSRSDGSDLVAVASMTQIGSTGAYKYDEGTNRITDGEAVVVQVQATIDGSTRTWRKLVSRDASA